MIHNILMKKKTLTILFIVSLLCLLAAEFFKINVQKELLHRYRQIGNNKTIVESQQESTSNCHFLYKNADYEKEAIWSEQGLNGCKRYLDKVIRLGNKVVDGNTYSKSIEKDIHRTIKKVTDDMDASKFNTALSALMILLNKMEKEEQITKADYRTYLVLLNPIAPHITEELNEEYQLGKPICESSWPTYDEAMLEDSEKEIAVQVNGKVRATITVNADDDEKTIAKTALYLCSVCRL